MPLGKLQALSFLNHDINWIQPEPLVCLYQISVSTHLLSKSQINQAPLQGSFLGPLFLFMFMASS